MSGLSGGPGHPVSAHNISFVGHSDMNGKSDGVQVMVHRGHAYVGHTFSNGITVLDVRDPRKPRVVNSLDCRPIPAPIICRSTTTCWSA
jgi:hypothetical protein